MTDAQPLTIVTYDWVPEMPRGFVRDIRPRWAAEEAGLGYRVETVPLRQKTEAHRVMQPFEQVPILKDGALTHLRERRDPAGTSASAPRR